MPKAKERYGKKSFSRPSLPPFFTVPQKGGETIHQTHTAAQPSAVALVSQHGTNRAIEAVFATSTVQGEVFVFLFTYLPRCVNGGHNDPDLEK